MAAAARKGVDEITKLLPQFVKDLNRLQPEYSSADRIWRLPMRTGDKPKDWAMAHGLIALNTFQRKRGSRPILQPLHATEPMYSEGASIPLVARGSGIWASGLKQPQGFRDDRHRLLAGCFEVRHPGTQEA
jgi:hypothetical protein